MEIYAQASRFMQQTGNRNQWIKGYPSRELIERDIAQGESYVCLADNGEIAGTFCFTQAKEDPTYLTIYQGAWLNNEPYGVVHRMAGTGKQKGMADFCFRWCFRQCGNIRVDTHKENRIMRKILERNGYTECGIIFTANGGERIAYQKTSG